MTNVTADGDAPTLVGISFSDAFRAREFLTAATRLAANGQLKLKDAVFVSKDAEGQTRVQETMDPGPGRSALSGAAWAGLLGLILGGPVGWAIGAGVGAGTGAITAKVIDHGIPDEWVDWFREAVQPNTMTLALLLEDADPGALVEEARRFAGARLVYANLPSEWENRIREALGESSPPTGTNPAGNGAPLPPPQPLPET